MVVLTSFIYLYLIFYICISFQCKRVFVNIICHICIFIQCATVFVNFIFHICVQCDRLGKIVLHLFIGIQLGKKDNILGSIPNQLGSIGSIPRSYHPKPRPSTPMDLFDMLIVLDQKEILWIHKLFNPSNWVTNFKIFSTH